jgi:hypothetical protein
MARYAVARTARHHLALDARWLCTASPCACVHALVLLGARCAAPRSPWPAECAATMGPVACPCVTLVRKPQGPSPHPIPCSGAGRAGKRQFLILFRPKSGLKVA